MQGSAIPELRRYDGSRGPPGPDPVGQPGGNPAGAAAVGLGEPRFAVPEQVAEVMSATDGLPGETPAAIAPKKFAQPSVSDREPDADVTARAQEEAMRRYPAIGVKDSDENQLYLTRVADLKSEMPDLMKDPHWPLLIAEQLAAQEGWKRADQPADDTAPPTPVSEDGTKTPRQPLPPEPADPSVPPPPPTPSNVPQEAPPTAK